MNNMNTLTFKFILVLLGAFAIILGLDFGLGGIETLGLLGLSDFIEATDNLEYGIQDSNIRFFGGMLGALGLFVIFAITDLPKYQQALRFVFVIIFAGGLARFTAGDMDVLLSLDVIAALSIELGLMFILYFWLGRIVPISH